MTKWQILCHIQPEDRNLSYLKTFVWLCTNKHLKFTQNRNIYSWKVQMSSTRANRKRSVFLFAFLATSLITTLVFCLCVLLPAWNTRHFIPVCCKISKILKYPKNCDCGADCISGFTCASIFVEFSDLDNGGLRQSKAAEEGSVFTDYSENDGVSYVI